MADTAVGRLRMRVGDPPADETLVSLLRTLIASEVERRHAPERASEESASEFVRAVLSELADRAEIAARADELGVAVEAGAGVLVVRAHPRTTTDDDWRLRLLSVARRGARSVAAGTIAAPVRDEPARSC